MMEDEYGYYCARCLGELEHRIIDGRLVLRMCANGCPP